MNFDLSEEQQLVSDSIERFVLDNYDLESRVAIVKQTPGFSLDYWKTMSELGWLGLPFSEEDGGFGGDQPEVGVKAGGGVVVVAGAQVCVTAQAVLVTADQHRELAVDLEAHDAVDHVDAAIFHALGPFDIGGLVAAGFQLDEHGEFLAAFGRVD